MPTYVILRVPMKHAGSVLERRAAGANSGDALRASMQSCVLYESDVLLAQVLGMHYGPASRVAAPLIGEGGLLQVCVALLHTHHGKDT
eukprot:scaffold99010_cov19-Tisochrysis_lutea.AAC.1